MPASDVWRPSSPHAYDERPLLAPTSTLGLHPMHPRTHFTLAAILSLLAACSGPKFTSSERAALPNGMHIGVQMQPKATVRLSVVDATPEKFFEQTLLVEATVTGVCQKMGCWMKIEDDGHAAMVRWESGCGGKYAFPKDAAGKRVLIQGSFYRKKISEADAQEMESESGRNLTIPRDTCEINASSVLILDPATR